MTIVQAGIVVKGILRRRGMQELFVQRRTMGVREHVRHNFLVRRVLMYTEVQIAQDRHRTVVPRAGVAVRPMPVWALGRITSAPRRAIVVVRGMND